MRSEPKRTFRAPGTKPISSANRTFLLLFVVVSSAAVFASIFIKLGLPGICSLGPTFGISVFVSWLLSDRPEVPARSWIAQAVSFFVIWPVTTYFADMLLP